MQRKHSVTLLYTCLVIAAALLSGSLQAEPTPVHRLAGPLAWGELAFTPTGDLLVPRVEVVTLDPEEAALERARRQAWLEQPTDKAVDELVRPDTNEGEAMLRFRRWMAQHYIEWLRANPDAALEGGVRRIRAITLLVLRPSRQDNPILASIPLWEGDTPAVSQTRQHGGLGTGTTETFELANVWAGSLAGSRWLAAWAWIKGKNQPPQTLILEFGPDGSPVQTPHLLVGVRPLAWTGSDTLLAVVRDGSVWYLAELVLDQTGAVRNRRVLATAPSPNVEAALIPGARRALLARGFVVYELDLNKRRLHMLKLRNKPVRTSSCGTPLASSGAVWLTEGPVGSTLLALSPAAEGWQIQARKPLPWRMGEDPWCNPLAEDARGRLLLGRVLLDKRSLGPHATAAATTGWRQLHVMSKEAGQPVPLIMDPVHMLWGNRPVAVSPDGRWIAVRMDTHELQVWQAGSLFPRR